MPGPFLGADKWCIGLTPSSGLGTAPTGETTIADRIYKLGNIIA